MYFSPSGEGCVINGSDAVRTPRSMSGDRRGRGKERVCSGCSARDQLHAGVASGRQGGSRWSNEEVTGGAGVVALIS